MFSHVFLSKPLCNSQQNKPAIPMEAPSRPWKMSRTDLFLHNSKWYLLVADYYREFPWVQKIPATSTKDMISALSFCFSVLATPEKVTYDSGTQFTRQGVQKVSPPVVIYSMSSPHFPISHAFIERQVQTIMKLLSR